MRIAVIALITWWACCAPGTLRAETFRSRFIGPTQSLGKALADTVARSLPVLSASPGVTFTYDPGSGGYVRRTDLLGQLYLERAQPIGRGRWNVMLSYQRVHVDSVQGQDIETLSDTGRPIIVGASPKKGGRLITFDHYDLDLTVNQVTLAGTYGITDDLDVNLLLPILASSLTIDARRQPVTADPNHPGSVIPLAPTAFVGQQQSDTASGVGDMLLRAKYRFLEREWIELAGGLMLRIPTGNKDNFQGTGDWELSPLLYASTKRFPVTGKTAISFYVNGGVDLNISDVDISQGRFGAGADFSIGKIVTLSLAFLGREPFHGFQPTGAFDLPRYPASGVSCVPGKVKLCPMAPLFGLDTDRPSYYSLSVGGRVNLWRDTLFGFANVLIPLTNQGIRSAPIPLVGFEATF